MAMDLTVVIPCFDEEHRVDACLEEVTRFLDHLDGVEAEVVVVDDGSRDGTAARVRAWSERRAGVRLVALPENRGKGEAVREGVRAARGEIVVFLDADLAVPPSTVESVLPALR